MFIDHNVRKGPSSVGAQCFLFDRSEHCAPPILPYGTPLIMPTGRWEGGVLMGVRNARRQELRRLEAKTLDARFLTEIQQGLNCSPFEAEAVLKVVKEVYFPFLDQVESPPTVPGKITVVAVCADEPARKPISKRDKRVVSLTPPRRPEHHRLLQHQRPAALRRARIPDLCQEALSQGGLL